mgnify:CR=1 FL=1
MERGWNALAKGAKSRGAKIFEDTAVEKILIENGRAVGVRTDAFFALGNTAYADQTAPWCKVGDRVLFAKYAGTMCQGQDGKTYRLINDLDVKAILDPVEGDSNA